MSSYGIVECVGMYLGATWKAIEKHRPEFSRVSVDSTGGGVSVVARSVDERVTVRSHSLLGDGSPSGRKERAALEISAGIAAFKNLMRDLDEWGQEYPSIDVPARFNVATMNVIRENPGTIGGIVILPDLDTASNYAVRITPKRDDHSRRSIRTTRPARWVGHDLPGYVRQTYGEADT